MIGLSNVFDTAGDLGSAWVGGAVAAATLWVDLPIVGYHSGGGLPDAAHDAGFESIGELIVWIGAPTSSG